MATAGGPARHGSPLRFGDGIGGEKDVGVNRAMDPPTAVAFASSPAAAGQRTRSLAMAMKPKFPRLQSGLSSSAERVLGGSGQGERRQHVPDLNFTASTGTSTGYSCGHVKGQRQEQVDISVNTDLSGYGSGLHQRRVGIIHPVRFQGFDEASGGDGDVAVNVWARTSSSCVRGIVSEHGYTESSNPDFGCVPCESSTNPHPHRNDDQEAESCVPGVQPQFPASCAMNELLDLNARPEDSAEFTILAPQAPGDLLVLEGESGEASGEGWLVPCETRTNLREQQGIVAVESRFSEEQDENNLSAGAVNAGRNALVDLNAMPQERSDVVVPDNALVECIVGGGVVPWKTRNRTSTGPDHRERIAGRPSALQQALMKFGQRTTDYVIDPAIGTEFDDRQEAYEYYNLYSWEIGFGIRVGKTRYSNDSKNRKLPDKDRYVLSQEYNCSCSGRPGKNVKTTSSLTDCPAMLRINRTKDNGWVVVAHNSEHNHELSESYGEKKQWPSHHHLDKYTKDLVRMLRENNVGITKLYSILGNFFGSMENVPTTKRCLKNLCQKINREQAHDDINKTLDLFRELRKADPGFMFSVDPDSEGRIKTLLWTNSRSRMQYQHFGDVITFDTTYKTNLYEMPFGLFVGVNNHFQSVLLGGVLMTDETIESFKWVFREFASLMGGKPPNTILTDQCRAMEVAIAEEWKETVHRWCKWHVLRRVAECVGPKYTQNSDFRDNFHKMLNEMLTIEEFEKAWANLLDEYGLQSNAFLKQIYETRQMWVKSYFKGVFCARMTSTQRSESANHMLKNIVQPNCPLHQFVQQYMKLQYIRDEEENYQERKSKLNKKCKKTGGPLVMEAHKIYTHKVFNLFCELKEESEFYRCIEMIPEKEYVTEHYELTRVSRWIKGSYRVSVSEEGTKYSCECGLFDHFGLPCSHIMRVLISTGADKIPESLIMKRWTKKARSDVPGYMSEYTKENPALMALTYRHSSLMIKVLKFVEMGDSNVESHKMAMEIIEAGINALAEVSKVKDGMGLADRQQQESEEEDEVGGLFDNFPQRVPKKRNERGRPTNTRDKPAYEVGSKRPRCCSVCRSDQHNKLKCPLWDQALNRPRQPPTCSGCGVAGHTIDKCVADVQQLAVVANLLV